MSDETPFGDFDEDDVIEDFPELTEEQWEQVASLQNEIDSINEISDDAERKLAVKELVQRMNRSI